MNWQWEIAADLPVKNSFQFQLAKGQIWCTEKFIHLADLTVSNEVKSNAAQIVKEQYEKKLLEECKDVG